MSTSSQPNRQPDLIRLTKAALFYNSGGDQWRSRVLEAFIYGRYNIDAIGAANVKAIKEVDTTLGVKIATVEIRRQIALIEAGEHTQAVAADIEFYSREDAARIRKLLEMLGVALEWHERE